MLKKRSKGIKAKNVAPQNIEIRHKVTSIESCLFRGLVAGIFLFVFIVLLFKSIYSIHISHLSNW
ncbi:MAG: hypothetical protein QG594_702 [Bacteroidota bacterium]|nr:hypothetical protein [Bacteroidota bacterium]